MRTTALRFPKRKLSTTTSTIDPTSKIRRVRNKVVAPGGDNVLEMEDVIDVYSQSQIAMSGQRPRIRYIPMAATRDDE